MLTMSLYSIDTPYLVTSAIIIESFGAAVVYPLIFVKSFEVFPEIKGTVSSATTTLRMLLVSATLSITAFVYDGRLLNLSLVLLIINVITITLTTCCFIPKFYNNSIER